VVVTQSSFYLSDLFETLPESVAKEAEMTRLGPSPAPGRKARLLGKDLEKSISKFSWPTLPKIKDMTIYRKSQTLTQKELDSLINHKMEETHEGSHWKILLDNAQFRLDMALEPSQPPDLTQFEYDPTHHRFSATLAVYDDDQCPSYYPLTGRLIRLVDVPVLTDMKHPGDLIEPTEITFMAFRSDQLPPNVILNKDQLIGLSPKNSPLKPHEPLRLTHLTKPFAVRRGSMVSLVLNTPHIQLVQRKSEALEDGAIGHFIKVKNLDSQRVLMGRIKESGVVEIIL
jgi:flagella basal body P-ring formation protein FlgA